MDAYWKICFFALTVGSLVDAVIFYYFFIEEKGYEMYSRGYKEMKERGEKRRRWRKKAEARLVERK